MKGRGTRSWLARGAAQAAFVATLALCVHAQESGEAPKEAPRFTEQSIYIPYENLRRVFEKEGRGVFLPYERFRELWDAAKAKSPDAPPDDKPRSPALVSEMTGQAVVDQGVVRFEAKLRVEILEEGWCEVPLRLRDVAVTRAQMNGKPARLGFDPGEGYRLIVERAKGDSGALELELEFAKAYERAPGQNSVSFETPQAPVSRWDITIPEPGVKVNIHPLLAAAEMPSESDKRTTRVQAFVGAAPTVRLEWTPKSEGAKGMEALAQVETTQGLVVDEGVVRVKTQLNYAISRAALSSLELKVPASFRIVNVYDPNVREWSVDSEEAAQNITVQLFEAAQGSQSLVVELERFFETEEDELEAPVVQAMGVGRQQGVVAVRAAPGFRLEAAERTGLIQVSQGELPASLKQESWSASYRFSTVPYLLTLSLETVKPRILAKSLVLAHIAPESLRAESRIVYDIQRAGVFQLALSIPSGFDVRSVTGISIGQAQPVRVQSYHVDSERDTPRLTVDLSEKALNHAALEVTLYRDLSEPDLLRPTGRAVQLDLPIPRVTGVEREEGGLVVCGKESLRIQAEDTTGLRPVSYAEAVHGFSVGLEQGETSSLSYAFGQTEAALRVAAERRRPHVTVGQLLSVTVEAGVAKFEASLFYDVLYSGVEGLYLEVPEELADDKIRLVTPGFERRRVEGEKGDEGGEDQSPQGFARWKLTGGSEISGSGSLKFVWEEKIEKLDAGKSTTMAVPSLRPRLADRSWGQVVMSKAETMDVAPTGQIQGLRPIDPQTDLMRGIKIPGAARAYEFHDDWRLSLQITRYELKEVKATSVESGLVRMVLTRGGSTSVQAVYRVKSARQRLAVQLPGEPSFDSQPARINGTAVPLEEGDGRFHVPLTSQDPETPFLLELRYVTDRSGSSLECPSFPEDPATQRVYLSVYLPEDRDFVGVWGPWTDENIWRAKGFSIYPNASMNDEARIRQMASGISVDPGALLDFPTEGSHLLFSTIRPPAGAKGALRLFSLKRWVFKGFVLTIVIGGGLALLRFGFRERAAAVGSGVVVLVFLAVFFPTLARQTTDGVLLAACLVVGVVWTLWYLLVTRPNDPDLRARRELRRQRRKSPPPLRRGLDEAWKDAEMKEKNAKQSGPPDQGREETGGPDDA